MSRFGALETAVATQLATITSFAETRVVPAGMLLATRPTQYPAAFVSLDNPKRTAYNVVNGHTTITWTVTVYVLIYANSDGVQLGDARISAWTLADAVIDAFLNFWPTGFAAGTAPLAPCIPGDPANLGLDAGQAEMSIPLDFSIQTIK